MLLTTLAVAALCTACNQAEFSTTGHGDSATSSAVGRAPSDAGAPSVAVLTGVDGSAAAALASLPIKGRAPLTGYSRTTFGGVWAGDGHGCDTRNDVLKRDLTMLTYRSGDCTVASGVLADPYTGQTMHFVRGETTSALVQIDHVAAIGDLWQTGAQQLTQAQRVSIYNDPLELLAVNGSQNEIKGDGDAATWLPPNKAFRCRYVALQIAVKANYGLWVTPAEHDAMARVLATCPGARLPSGQGGR